MGITSKKVLILFNSSWLRDLAGAWIFYTVFPALPWVKPRFERIARFAPLIGIWVGLIQAIIWLILAYMGWSKESLAPLSIGIGICITGGLHLDGLMDTADGIAAGKQRCSEAMQDSRVGAIGVQGLAFILLCQLAALLKLDSLAPFALPIAMFWGRFSPLWAIEKFPYLHKKNSRSFHQFQWRGWHETKPSFIALSILILLVYLTPLNLINALSLTIGISTGILPALIIPDLLGRQLGGHSGDSYGASVVLVETFVLLFLAFTW